MLCPSQPLGSALWTLTLACTGMEFATPLRAPAPDHWPFSPCPGQFPKAPSCFCFCPSLSFPPWRKSPEWYPSHNEDQTTQGTGPPSDQSSPLGSPVPLTPCPSNLRAPPYRLWGLAQCSLPCPVSSDQLLDPACLPVLSCALQNSMHDLPQPPLIICYLL